MSDSPEFSVAQAALTAYQNGWLPIPIAPGQKKPSMASWSSLRYDTEEDIRERFKVEQAGYSDPLNLGLLLGEASNGLVDVDLDHPIAKRLASLILPPTAMVSGRGSSPRSHYWYVCSDEIPPGTRRYKLPDGSTTIELRSTGGQTLIAPSIAKCSCVEGKAGPWCKDGAHLTEPEPYTWEGDPYGGVDGPAYERGVVLSARVATVAMLCVLVDGWPASGGRHDAYLALAGGLLRYGGVDGETGAIHPLWEKSLPNIIRVLAEATLDHDGADTRVDEVMGSTLKRLRVGGKAQGFPTLARIIGDDHVRLVVEYAREIEGLLGYAQRAAEHQEQAEIFSEDPGERAERLSTLPTEERDPLRERVVSWEPVDLGPYLAGEARRPEPGVLRREDGVGLFYPGRVNSLYGSSESGKTWMALAAMVQSMKDGEKVMLVDCEDEPPGLIDRLRKFGMSNEQIFDQFTYLHPETPIAAMQRNRWGEPDTSEAGRDNLRALTSALDTVQPGLIVIDGLTALYGMHGLNTNDATSTDVVTSWTRWLTASGDRTVIIIDHTSKGSGPGATPMGSQHKLAMIQGTALQVTVITRPRPNSLGELRVYIGKDRPGLLREASPDGDPQVATDVDFHSEGESIRMEFKAPDPHSMVIGADDSGSRAMGALADHCEAILVALTRKEGAMRLKEIKAAMAIDLTPKQMDKAMSVLRAEGRVKKSGTGKTTWFRLGSED